MKRDVIIAFAVTIFLLAYAAVFIWPVNFVLCSIIETIFGLPGGKRCL